MKTWKQKSFEIIDERFNAIRKAQPQLTAGEVLRLVSLHYYPFGIRSDHPYKAWLAAMIDFKKKLGLISSQKEAASASAQFPLFK